MAAPLEFELHVFVKSLPAAAVGAVVLVVTNTLSVSVQPLAAVAVTVYVLALLIVAAALLPKLLSQL